MLGPVGQDDAIAGTPRVLPTAAPEKELEDIGLEEARLAQKGHYEVYTDLNYHTSPENQGRTWQQDGRTLVHKRMANGELKNLIYVWH